ncbi:hypothetical protein NX722_22575 [Endozoicomonas gorgoniicola]|uniref:Addiction module toxin RelE n=1 Tax=Endozoicomonas gorgoniicola TaxID=1234144 RepID=A0ABT3N164_9GAMM|nr:hypothetical protein [Endozoicomonas gorgoniicola]MCW7555364.1 hypothetical protein [Endozoicomonas gorgoniicola]
MIYFYHSEGIPLFLLTVYGKNEQGNLTKAQRHEMRKVTEVLVRQAQIRKTRTR